MRVDLGRMNMSVSYFRSDGWVKSSLGPAIPGAQIFVCLQPANVASLPPSPLAPVFSDPNGLVPLSLPILTDGFGHYDFYAQAGTYTLVVGLGGVIQRVYPDQSVGGSSASGTALVLSTNGVQNANQFALNLESTDGSITVTNDSSGNTNLSGTKGFLATIGSFIGPGFQTPFPMYGGNTTTTGTVSGVANRIIAWKFILPFAITISKVTVSVGTGSAGQTCNFGIYSSTGTKLLDSGPLDAHTAPLISTNSITPVTLQPGTYFFAQSANANSVQVYASPMTNPGETVLNANNIAVGISPNPTVAGVMPASLGTLTADGTSTSVALALFEA